VSPLRERVSSDCGAKSDRIVASDLPRSAPCCGVSAWPARNSCSSPWTGTIARLADITPHEVLSMRLVLRAGGKWSWARAPASNRCRVAGSFACIDTDVAESHARARAPCCSGRPVIAAAMHDGRTGLPLSYSSVATCRDGTGKLCVEAAHVVCYTTIVSWPILPFDDELLG
jgi:hypothetical protein